MTTSSLQYLEQYEQVATAVLRCAQLFGAAPYSVDLASFSAPKYRHKWIEISLQAIQTLWTLILFILACEGSRYFFVASLRLPIFTTAVRYLFLSSNLLSMVLICVFCRILKSRYRQFSTSIGGLLYAFHQDGYEIDVPKLWRNHRSIVIAAGLFLPIDVAFLTSANPAYDLFSLVSLKIPELIVILSLNQQWFALGLIVEMLRFCDREFRKVGEQKKKLIILQRRVRILCKLADEITQLFGAVSLLQLLRIIANSTMALSGIGFNFKLKHDTQTFTLLHLFFFMEITIVLLKLALITYRQHCLKREVSILRNYLVSKI